MMYFYRSHTHKHLDSSIFQATISGCIRLSDLCFPKKKVGLVWVNTPVLFCIDTAPLPLKDPKVNCEPHNTTNIHPHLGRERGLAQAAQQCRGGETVAKAAGQGSYKKCHLILVQKLQHVLKNKKTSASLARIGGRRNWPSHIYTCSLPFWA